jgi:hypothetical protein
VAIIVTLSMTPEDADRLEAAFKEGKLKALGVVEVRRLSPEEIAEEEAQAAKPGKKPAKPKKKPAKRKKKTE